MLRVDPYTIFQNTNATKKGWPWIEELYDKHDRTWVEGYNEDMDALLVFVSNCHIEFSTHTEDSAASRLVYSQQS